jgi:DNA mismatch repair ATPase MutS
MLYTEFNRSQKINVESAYGISFTPPSNGRHFLRRFARNTQALNKLSGISCRDLILDEKCKKNVEKIHVHRDGFHESHD